MKTMKARRLAPSEIPSGQLLNLLKALDAPKHPALVSGDGIRTELPEPVFAALLQIVQMMSEGRTIVLMPEDEAFTTQAAANFLGVSRQFLVNLLDGGEIPHHRVGKHRRVAYKDLMDYDTQRQRTRRGALSGLTKRLKEEGVYDAEVKGEDAG